jgi:hypothetical protein
VSATRKTMPTCVPSQTVVGNYALLDCDNRIMADWRGTPIGATLSNYCLAKASEPLFVTVLKSPLEVMSVVPAKEFPLILP